MKPADLPPDQQAEALGRYYAGEPVRAIIAAYGIDCVPGTFLRAFPPVPCETPCPHCGAPMTARRATRMRARAGKPAQEPAACTRCRHRDRPNCTCPGCAARPRMDPRRRPQPAPGVAHDATLLAAWEAAYACRPEPADLGVREAVFLIAATRAGLDAAGETLRSVGEYGQRLAPGRDYTATMVRTLAAANVIAIDPGAAPPGAVGDLRRFIALHAERVRWRLALGRDGAENRGYLARLWAVASERWSLDAHGEVLADLWYEAVLEECVAHLGGQLAHFGLAGDAALALRDTLAGLLAHLSGGEVIAATWSASKSVAAERHAGRGPGDPSIAVAAYLHALFDRFIEGRLVPFAYERSRHQPASALAELLAGPLLGLGGDYLKVVPSLATLWARRGAGPPARAHALGG